MEIFNKYRHNNDIIYTIGSRKLHIQQLRFIFHIDLYHIDNLNEKNQHQTVSNSVNDYN